MIGKSYIMTSDKFEGEIELVYDERDKISAFEIRTDLRDEQLERFFGRFPITVDDVKNFEKSPGVTVLEVPEDLSFDKFWAEWCGKAANKERSKSMWDKLPKKHKVRCIWSLKAYKRYIDRNSSWYNPQYPDSYLSTKKPGWLNDWNKM